MPHPPAATRRPAVARTSVPRRSPRPAPTPSDRRRIPAAPFLGVAAVAAVALLAFVMVPAVGGLFSNTRNDTDTSAKGQAVAEWRAPRTALVERLSGAGSTVAAQAENPPHYLDLGTTKTGEGRVSFSAVGDNLFNENLLDIADAAAGVAGDGKYGFDGFYRKIKKKIASYDISFVNQETTLGGPDRYGYNGYPSYNTPDALAPVVAKVGWDVVTTNSNHVRHLGPRDRTRPRRLERSAGQAPHYRQLCQRGRPTGSAHRELQRPAHRVSFLQLRPKWLYPGRPA